MSWHRRSPESWRRWRSEMWAWASRLWDRGDREIERELQAHDEPRPLTLKILGARLGARRARRLCAHVKELSGRLRFQERPRRAVL